METRTAVEPIATLLRAAHTAEHQFLDAVKKYLEAVDRPEVRERISGHLVEMQWQIRLLEACLEFQDNGDKLPDAEARRCAAEISKEGLLAIKRFKIALYKKIITAARRQQAPEVLQACREILEQERSMAEWIEDNYSDLPAVPFG